MNTKRFFVPFDLTNLYQLQPGDIIPAINICWLIGFIEGDGSFVATKSGASLSIGQKYISINILKAIELFFSNLPNSYGITVPSPKPKPRIGANRNTKVIIFQWSNIDALYDYILPILQANADLFVSRKKLDFILWATVVTLNKTGLIYTPEGKTLMEKIRSNFNHRRYSNNINATPINIISQAEINQVLSLPPFWDLTSGLPHMKLVYSHFAVIRNSSGRKKKSE